MADIKEKITLIRTIGAEYIIGYEMGSDNQICEDDGIVRLREARSLDMKMTPSGQLALMLIPLMPYSASKDTTASIHKSAILKQIGEEDIVEKLVKAYQGEISGLDLTTASSASNIII